MDLMNRLRWVSIRNDIVISSYDPQDGENNCKETDVGRYIYKSMPYLTIARQDIPIILEPTPDNMENSAHPIVGLNLLSYVLQSHAHQPGP